MHILVTNDDGPPSAVSSPYILPFVQALEKAGHEVSVIIPNEQRSWIGKAHIIGRDVTTKYYQPPEITPPDHRDDDSSGALPTETTQNGAGKRKRQPWVLVDSTPASCAQLGASELFFRDRGKVDLGRNTTAVFALSSGTLGAALEAAICGYRAIALSFAFFDRKNDPEIVQESCTHAVRVCEWLANQEASSWDNGRTLYSVNVPLQKGVSTKRVGWTRMLQNQWQKGACFEEIAPAQVADPEEEEAKLRKSESRQDRSAEDTTGSTSATEQWKTRHFKWAPRFTDVYDSVAVAGPGSDGWAVKEGETSITALRPNFMHVDGFHGEIKL